MVYIFTLTGCGDKPQDESQETKTAASTSTPKIEIVQNEDKEITKDFLNSYEKWMLENEKSYSTISIYVRCLRKLFNEAIDFGNSSKTIFFLLFIKNCSVKILLFILKFL